MPIKLFIHSINRVTMHWHREIEILLVLKGSVNLRIATDEYIMKEDDFILLNPNEVHSVMETEDENILLALQIQTDFFNKYILSFGDKVFDCKSFLHEKEDRFNRIRVILAKLVWEINKKKPGYEFNIISEIANLGSELIENFSYEQLEDDTAESISRDMFRLNRIINYIDENISEKITLKELAEKEDLSIYYLSHYIKKALGISFQEYVNIQRLNHSINLLITTDHTITEIATESGFASTRALNTIMKRTHSCTPSEYRERHRGLTTNLQNGPIENKEKIKSRTYLDVDRDSALEKLFSYLELSQDNKEEVNTSIDEFINVDIRGEGDENDFYWRKLISFGRAKEGLDKSVQDQLREVQKDIGFEYIRCHGIFSDEMMLINSIKDGNLIYNWTYIDQLYDFFKEVNIKPFVELSFMPSELRSSDKTVFWWKGNISPPKYIELWKRLVMDFIKHCINRYGLEEVESWYFEVWNEPSFENVFWSGSKEEYFDFYRETALAIKSISENLKVGGPSISYEKSFGEKWMDKFLIYCEENHAALDFISVHIYPEAFNLSNIQEENKDKDVSAIYQSQIDALGMIPYSYMIYHGIDHTEKTLDLLNEKTKDTAYKQAEVHITEWNVSSYIRNLINDTCFTSSFIIKSILNSMGKADSFGYWTFTDLMEEFKLGASSFHGGFGLINKDGLKKASYYAYYFLSKLGKRIIEHKNDYIITKDNEDIQVLVFNFTYFDELFMRGDISRLKHKNRYDIFAHKADKSLSLCLEGLNGRYKSTRYELNRAHGSVFDQWVKLGAPENMTKEEKDYLKGKSKPKMTVDYIDIEEKYETKLYIPVHGVELITLEKQI